MVPKTAYPIHHQNATVGSNQLLYPIVGLAGIIVVLTGLVSLRQPLGPWLPAVATLGVGGCIWAFYKSRQLGVWWMLAICVSWAALAVVSGQAWPWPTVSTHPDAWSYSALATYLTDNVRGVNVNLPLVDQYASHLQNTRFASPSLLALVIYCFGEQHLFMAHTMFYVLCLVTLVFSTGYLCGSLGLSPRQSLLASGATALLGWTINALIIGNYDNLLFVALMPAALGVLVRFQNSALRTGAFCVAGGTLMAALLCTYPEGLALTSVLITPLGVASCWRLRQERHLWVGYTVAGLLVLLLASPYLPVFFSFLNNQLTTGVANTGMQRDGSGTFPGLLGWGFGPALFALGNEFPDSQVHVYHYLLPVIGSLLALLGAWRLRMCNPWFPWVLVLCTGLLLWQTIVNCYDYGTYKVIFCMGWWLFPAMVTGGWWLAERWGRPLLVMLVAVALIAGAGLQRWSLWAHRVCPPQTGLDAMTELPAIRFITREQPVLLNMHSDFEQLWAVALLKSIPLLLDRPKSYLAMPHVQPVLANARQAPVENGLWVLRAGKYPGAIWQNQHYALFRAPVTPSAPATDYRR